MRIGLLCHSSVGGSVNVAVDLARGLSRRGHDVHVFSPTAPPGLDSKRDRVRLHTLGAACALDPRLRTEWSDRERAAFVELLCAAGQRHTLDVLHFHYALPFAEIALAAQRRLGGAAPVVVGTLHGTDVDAGRDRQLASVLEGVDALTTVSRSHAALAMRELGLNRRPRVVINSIDLRRFSALQPPSARGRVPRVLHVSNFRAVKDPARLARTFVEVRGGCACELWLVGDGEEMPHVKAILSAGGVMDDVALLGLRTDVESLYPHADVVLLTSRRESFSLVAIEAAACGVPVIAPRVGGLPEVVVDGRTGLLYDAADPAQPAAALRRLLGDGPLRAAMGAAAARHARRFSHDHGVERYERLYREVLRERAADEAAPAPAP